MKRVLSLFLLACSLPVFAQSDANMRIAGRMAFPDPELAKPGACVQYREGGAGWILTEPEYWLRGTVISSELRTRRVERCLDLKKPVEQTTREEFVRLATQQPCVSRDDLAREESWGAVRLRVEAWETPYGKRLANSGRLYQAHYLEQPLVKGGTLEIDAALLGACR